MNPTARPTIALALESPEDESLWRAILESQGVLAIPGLRASAQEGVFTADARLAGCAAIVADVPALMRRGQRPLETAAWLKSIAPQVPFLLRLPGRAGIGKAQRAWAQANGIASLLPGGSVAAWRESIAPVAERILTVAGLAPLDVRALERLMHDLLARGVEPRPGPMKDLYADAFLLESEGVDAMALLQAMQRPDGVAVAERGFRGKRYPGCFIASEAIDWLVGNRGLRRSSAEIACRFLWRAGRIHHVVREAKFSDDYLFFRFSGVREVLDGVDLSLLLDAMRAPDGLDIADRTWRGMAFPRCFVGIDAVEWIAQRERMPFGAAESLGQSLLELGEIRHVSGDHEFMGERFYYRLTSDVRSGSARLAAA